MQPTTLPLASIKSWHLKKIADLFNDFLYDEGSRFSYNQSYIMVLDIIETKLFKEPKETIEKYFPKNRCN